MRREGADRVPGLQPAGLKPQVVLLDSALPRIPSGEYHRARPERLSEGGTMPLPTLTEEQRRDALAKAAVARKKRAELKDQLKTGRLRLGDILARKEDDTVAKMRVSSVLESLPGVGKVRARKLMERLDISTSRRVRGLGAKQKEALLAEFSGK